MKYLLGSNMMLILFQHPITRFLAKYVMEDPKMSYYKDIYLLECSERDSRQV